MTLFYFGIARNPRHEYYRMNLIPLPMDAHVPALIASLRSVNNVVLVATPGAGKTTRVPPGLLAAGLVPAGQTMVMLQPRRVAARAVAQRIAQEQGWRLGEEVGYQVRFENCTSARTRIRIVTEGILTRQLLADPYLERVGVVVLDEFHERSIHSDLALALVRELQQTVRPELKIVVMSATLEATGVAAYLGDCPIIEVPGRIFPIAMHYEPLGDRELPRGAALAAANYLRRSAEGDVLVFLPGAEEIRRTQQTLGSMPGVQVVPLHGSLSAEEQYAALESASAGERKVILATNIAETSLTIPGVRCVVDSGLVRQARFDAQRGLDRLELVPASRASLTQRAGRAGRTAPGECVRLWEQRLETTRLEFTTPEVLRVDLTPTVLGLHAWGCGDSREFAWFTRPPEVTLAAAEQLLEMLGALRPTTDTRRELTPRGKQLLELPLHPRLARLLWAGVESGVGSEAALLAAVLSEKDFMTRPPHLPAKHRGPSDVLWRMDVLNQVQRSGFAGYWRDQDVDVQTARRVWQTYTQLQQMLPRTRSGRNTSGEDSETILLKLPLVAWPDRLVCRRAHQPDTGVMVGGAGVRQAAGSGVIDGALYLALEARHDSRARAGEALVTIASSVEAAWLETELPGQIYTRQRMYWDEVRQRVQAVTETCLADLVLRSVASQQYDEEACAEILAQQLRPQVRRWLEADRAAMSVLERVAFLHQQDPQTWPAWDEAALADLARPMLTGRRSVAEVQSLPWVQLLRGALGGLDRELNRLAPETIGVPSGSQIRVDYSDPARPVLAVRIQELFGLLDTPRVAGKVPVLLHLLAPNYRPVQMTQDLRSFWANAYFEVRKGLRIRYPKHSWPEDPLSAPPQAKGRSHKRD